MQVFKAEASAAAKDQVLEAIGYRPDDARVFAAELTKQQKKNPQFEPPDAVLLKDLLEDQSEARRTHAKYCCEVLRLGARATLRDNVLVCTHS